MEFDWDLDLVTGYDHLFLNNVAQNPSADRFTGCDCPSVADELVNRRPDVLLVTGWHLKCFWQGIFAAKRLGIPVMVRGDSHLETPRSALKKSAKAVIYPLMLRAFNVALYVGQRSHQYWRHYGYPAHRLIFSPHCVDNEWFATQATLENRAKVRESYGIPAATKMALFAGKFLPNKRPIDLISAIGVLNGHGCMMTMLAAGAGPSAESMASAANNAGVRLVQLGFRNQSEMPSVYAAADMLVLPSESETWGLVANEALASGIPIVVSDACGCAPDLAADGAAGRVFPVGDVAALAASLKELMNAPPSKDAIAAKTSRYSISSAVDGILLGIEVATCRKRKPFG